MGGWREERERHGRRERIKAIVIFHRSKWLKLKLKTYEVAVDCWKYGGEHQRKTLGELTVVASINGQRQEDEEVQERFSQYAFSRTI